ncbi:ATP-binding protein [Clostridium sp. UBA1056]|uniref:PAS domain-containing sensor histidine kinase n=1 Tax=unclassified Clostridium TaxID=2614128 RepID=UPI003216B6C0
MEFQNKLDLEFYNNISEPIIAIDIDNKITYCNEGALEFLGVQSVDSVEDIDINAMIKFSTLKNGVFNIKDFAPNNINEEMSISIDTRIYREIEIELVIRNIKVGNDEGALMLLKSIASKNLHFKSIDDNTSSNKLEEHEEFKYIVVDKYEDEAFISTKEMNLNVNFYKAIFAASTTGIVIEKENKISYINKVAMDIIGEPKDNVFLGKNLFELIKLQPIEYNDEFLKKQYSKYDSSLNIVERRFIREDGSIVYCEMTPMCFVNGNDIYSLFLIKDITRRIKVEEAVIKNRDNYVELLKLLPFGMVIYSDSKFEIGNKALSNILGFDDINELSNLSYVDILGEEYEDLIKEMYFDAQFRGKATEFKEAKAKKKDGSLLDAEIASFGINFTYGRSVVFFIQEVAERKKAQLNKVKLEQAIKYDKLKTEFISNMSHELKTPLNIILSTVQVLQYNYKDKNDEQLDRYLDLMKVNSYRLLRLINNLIDVTRIDVGNLKMNFGNYDIVAIVEDITMAAVEYVESKGMTLIFDTDVEEKIIGIDRENIERIVLNLLSNAVKFSKDDGTIMVSIHDLGNKVQISVKDNGIGIPEELQEKIFDRFVQGEDLFTRSHEGSGIGLSLVKSIVENHSGKIYVKSIVNGGSEFIVELPNILSKNQFCSTNLYHADKYNLERIKIEFSDIYK